jgi:hypothetical protein
MTWALDTFRAVRAGTLTGPIIDPETKKPLAGTHGGNGAAGAGTVAQASGETKVPGGAETLTRPSPAQPGVAPGERGVGGDTFAAEPADGGPEKLGPEDPVPVPGNLEGEARESFMLVGHFIRQLMRSGDLLPPVLPPPQG